MTRGEPHSRGIQRLRQTFDGAALAAGIPTFKGQYHGDPSAVDFAVEAGKLFLQDIKPIFVGLFIHGFAKIYAARTEGR